MLTETLIAEGAKQGLWAILYITLFVYVLRESKNRETKLRDESKTLRAENHERETKLINFINDISDQYERLANQYEQIAVDVQKIRSDLDKKVDRIELKNNNKKGE